MAGRYKLHQDGIKSEKHHFLASLNLSYLIWIRVTELRSGTKSDYIRNLIEQDLISCGMVDPEPEEARR